MLVESKTYDLDGKKDDESYNQGDLVNDHNEYISNSLKNKSEIGKKLPLWIKVVKTLTKRTELL